MNNTLSKSSFNAVKLCLPSTLLICLLFFAACWPKLPNLAGYQCKADSECGKLACVKGTCGGVTLLEKKDEKPLALKDASEAPEEGRIETKDRIAEKILEVAPEKALSQIKKIIKISSSEELVPLGIKVHSDGNIYIVGKYKGSMLWRVRSGASEIVKSVRGFDGFVLKMDPNGKIIWIYSLGGHGTDSINKLVLTPDHKILVIGSFEKEITFQKRTYKSKHGLTSFVIKLDLNGKAEKLISLGCGGECSFKDIAISSKGDYFITGQFSSYLAFSSKMYVKTAGLHQPFDMFIAHLSAKDEGLWLKSWGGKGEDRGEAIALYEKNGLSYIYFVGSVEGKVLIGQTTLSPDGQRTLFTMKMDGKEGKLHWIESHHHSDSYNPGSEGLGVTVDSKGNCYTSGQFWEKPIRFILGSKTVIIKERYDSGDSDEATGFVIRYSPSGVPQWVKGEKRSAVTDYSHFQMIHMSVSQSPILVGNYKGKMQFDELQCKGSIRDEQNSFWAQMDKDGGFQDVISISGREEIQSTGITNDVKGKTYTIGSFTGDIEFSGAGASLFLKNSSNDEQGFLLINPLPKRP